MSKIVPLRPGAAPVPTLPLLSPADLAFLKTASQALQESFDALWIIKACVDGVERHSNKIPFKDIPWVISKLRQVLATFDNQTHKRGNL